MSKMWKTVTVLTDVWCRVKKLKKSLYLSEKRVQGKCVVKRLQFCWSSKWIVYAKIDWNWNFVVNNGEWTQHIKSFFSINYVVRSFTFFAILQQYYCYFCNKGSRIHRKRLNKLNKWKFAPEHKNTPVLVIYFAISHVLLNWCNKL